MIASDMLDDRDPTLRRKGEEITKNLADYGHAYGQLMSGRVNFTGAGDNNYDRAEFLNKR